MPSDEFNLFDEVPEPIIEVKPEAEPEAEPGIKAWIPGLDELF